MRNPFKVGEVAAIKIVERLNFSKLGELIPVIVQDWKSGEVLMMAFANKEAVIKSLTTGLAHYWSRSRNKLWMKGETSGNVQIIKEIRVDCDEDSLLFKVIQVNAACHTGFYSCFYREINSKGEFEIKVKKCV
ncbi:MAG: phosphoribosyl-AMP cyclohydrolase [Candidatus Odinarchaeia archaeon]